MSLAAYILYQYTITHQNVIKLYQSVTLNKVLTTVLKPT